MSHILETSWRFGLSKRPWSQLTTGGLFNRKLEAWRGARSTRWSMIGGISSPLSLFRTGRRLWICMVSLYLRAQYLGSVPITLTFLSEQVCPVALMWSHTPELCLPSVCSLCLVPTVLPDSPTYSLSQLSHLTLYTVLHLRWVSDLSLGCTSKDLRVLKGLWYMMVLRAAGKSDVISRPDLGCKVERLVFS